MRKKAQPINIEIGKNIKNLRQKRGLSRAALGRSLGEPVSFQAIDHWESGRNRVSVCALVELAAILKCNINDILPHHSEALSVEDIAYTKHGQNLLRDYYALDNWIIQEAVRTLVKVIAQEMRKTNKDHLNTVPEEPYAT